MILIHNGLLVSTDGLQRADVLIDGERISAIVDPQATIASQLTDVQVVDATDLLVFPGLIDVHTHMRQPGVSKKRTSTRARARRLRAG